MRCARRCWVRRGDRRSGGDAIHISTSTISVRLSKELAHEHARRGQPFVAAPVLGRPDAAAEKRLWIIAAGTRATIDRCTPIFDALGRGLSVVGEQSWQANVAKIAVNFMLAAALEAMGEATALIRKSDMEPRVFIEVLNALFRVARVRELWTDDRRPRV
jgi:3-hydroxyisobutyrate dehydrogenase-like beta-hydroxyacid dehydrogenase